MLFTTSVFIASSLTASAEIDNNEHLLSAKRLKNDIKMGESRTDLKHLFEQNAERLRRKILLNERKFLTGRNRRKKASVFLYLIV